MYAKMTKAGRFLRNVAGLAHCGEAAVVDRLVSAVRGWNEFAWASILFLGEFLDLIHNHAQSV